MSWQKRTVFNKASIIVMIFGVLYIIISAFFDSSFLAVLGTAVVFWGVILFYLTPEKNLPLSLINSFLNGSLDNIERVLKEFNISEKGIYLPPKNLNDYNSSLIFIPKTSQTPLPLAEDVT